MEIEFSSCVYIHSIPMWAHVFVRWVKIKNSFFFISILFFIRWWLDCIDCFESSFHIFFIDARFRCGWRLWLYLNYCFMIVFINWIFFFIKFYIESYEKLERFLSFACGKYRKLYGNFFLQNSDEIFDKIILWSILILKRK